MSASADTSTVTDSVVDGVTTEQAPGTDPSTAPTSKKSGRGWIGIVGPFMALLLFIGVWYLMHYWALENVFDRPAFLITEPDRVINESFFDGDNLWTLLQGLYWTTVVAMTGLSISIVLGMTLAIAMAQATWLERSFWPYLVALQAVPILAITPIIASVFGFGFSARILVCVIISLFPIVNNTLFGLLSADRLQHDMFTLHGANRRTRLLRLQLPGAMPAIFTGFRIAAGLSVIGAVVGELFFRRGEKGIGILLDVYRQRNNYPLMYGALLLSSMLGIVVFSLFGWVGNRVVGKWYESTRDSR